MSSPFVPIEKASLDWHQDLPLSIKYDDIYHSAAGSAEQSRYVFIDGNHLISRWCELAHDSLVHFNIAETGFGTGLNFLLTWCLWDEYAPSEAHLHFISCEKHPLPLDDLIRCLKNWPFLSKYAELLIAKYPVLTPGFHQLNFNNGRVTLTLMLGDALECYEQLLVCGDTSLESELRVSAIDAWYLDGFSPQNNPEMWSHSLFNVIAMLSKDGTTLATYSAAGTVKTNLSEAGFTTVKLKGFGPKRHMISATFVQDRQKRLKKRHTPWHLGYRPALQDKKVIIVGAGLAGCFMAYSLATKGWLVTIIDENPSVGSGASANRQAVLFPKLSAYKSPLTQFMLSAYLYAHQFYSDLAPLHSIGELKGSFLLAHNEKEKLAQSSLKAWLEVYPELGQLLEPEQATQVVGIPLDKSGLFLPLSGWLDSPALCRFLINDPRITVINQQSVTQLIQKNNRWLVNDIQAEVLILANGYTVNRFAQTSYLPIKSIRGQMTSILSTTESRLLNIPLCGDGHVLPERNGSHSLGATYGLGSELTRALDSDDELNLSKLNTLTSSVKWSDKVLEHWVGIRASTPDYLPLVGPISIESEFISDYATFETNSKRWIPKASSYYPGLYAFAGFGSRGLTTIPLCAAWLSGFINQEMSSLPRNLVQALSPARFLRRNITRGKYK